MLARKYRVNKESILDVIKTGKRFDSVLFSLKKKKNGLLYNRFAVVVAKKDEKTSVGRHLIKRKIWNAIAEIMKDKVGGYDYVYNCKPASKTATFTKIVEEMSKLAV